METTTTSPSAPVHPMQSARRSRRLPRRLLIGAASLSLSASVLGGVAHAGEPTHQERTCDKPCAITFADSDGDGASDFYEVVVGTDPFNAASHPSADLNAVLAANDLVVTVRLDPELPAFVTIAPHVIDLAVDLQTAPDGTSIVTDDLVDPLTGKPFSTDHHGIDATAAGVDVGGLAQMVKADPGSAANLGVASLSLPTEKPELTNPNDPSIYSEEDPEDPPEPDESPDDVEDPAKPESNPDEGGDDGDGEVGADGKRKQLNSFEQQQKDKAAAAEKAAEKKGIVDTVVDGVKKVGCALTPGCHNNYSDPDAGGGSGTVTADPSNPPIRILTAPIDIVRGGQEPVEAPSGPPTDPNNDPTVTDPDPETIAGPTTIDPGTIQGSTIAPIDPPKPGTGDTPYPIPGQRP